MQEEIKKVRNEVLEAQKDAVVKEVATLKIQLDFIEGDHEAKVKEAKKITDKEQRKASVESLAQYRLQKINPMYDNIEYKTKYYEYLANLK